MMPFLIQTRSAVSIMYEKDVLEGLIATAILFIVMFFGLAIAIFRAKERQEKKLMYNFFGTLSILLGVSYAYRLVEWLQAYFSL